MNQTKIKNNYKEQETKKTMEKKLLITILMLLTLTLSAAFSEDVCRYIEGQTIFRCNDAMPNLVIVPGTEQNLTIYCCLTGEDYNNTDVYEGNIDITFNESYRTQYVENGTRMTQYNIDYYNASKWISAYYLPENITGFETFSVIITFKAPAFSNEYKASMSLKARFDLSIDIFGDMIPQLAILPIIKLPIDYKPIDYKIYIYSIGGAFLLIILLVITFKNNKINQKIKRLFKKHKKSEAHHEPDKETKEQKVEKKEEEKKNE
ncbi:MAG: hypothetical protein WC376_00945 [Candidatus Nanoarchaeia archaeon]|jgi:hypothetical protein